jgi:hypothetical protein
MIYLALKIILELDIDNSHLKKINSSIWVFKEGLLKD